jgi:glyoxylase-like metal-dependent hydrolase (beta-lactamase superfamily II)
MARNVEEILPGFYKIALPVPIRSLKSVFVYLLRDKDQSLLIDTGWAGEESYHALTSAFEDLDFDLRDLNNVVISHLHPDHFGLASRLKKEARNVTLMMHVDDAKQIRTNKAQMKTFWQALRELLKKNGAP